MGSIWTEDNQKEIAFFGFRGLPTIYAAILMREYRAYGLPVYQFGDHVIAVETQDLVVLTDIFRRYVPRRIMSLKGFTVISGNSRELAVIEAEFRAPLVELT